jgi:PAS domain S-box-containing protein
MIFQVIVNRDGTRKFTYLSDSVFDIFGITPEEGMADANLLYDKIYEEDVLLLKNPADEDFKKYKSDKYKADIRLYNSSGGTDWFTLVSTYEKMDEDSVCWDGIMFNISERKKAEELQKASEEKYRFIVNNAPVGIFQRKLNGEYIFFNNTEIKFFECKTREEFLENYGDILDRWEDPEALRKYQESLLKNKSVQNIEVKTRLKNGKLKWFLLSAFYDESNSVVNGFSVDITALKIAENK